ncbi:DHS-like NAD/FAD-binding domain-containing protein, partial [Endogone sp. FLAS-F59071]
HSPSKFHNSQRCKKKQTNKQTRIIPKYKIVPCSCFYHQAFAIIFFIKKSISCDLTDSHIGPDNHISTKTNTRRQTRRVFLLSSHHNKMTITITLSDPHEVFEPLLSKVNYHVWKAKRCLVVTGAGISCSGGIPDFRSSDGLYNLVKSKYPKSVVKGRDLFDATLFQNPTSTAVFYTFMAELHTLISRAHHTRAHAFLRTLHDQGKLLRCYTQNIDCLERRVDLPADMGDDVTVAPRAPGPPVVQLHGTIGRVKCTLCCTGFDFTDEHAAWFREGAPPACPRCEEGGRERERLGKRATSTGTLRPDIVLYNEHHPHGERIGELQAMDLKKRPDILIVMGTSLKIVGLKKFVKEAAKVVHAQKKGKVVFVNRTEPSKEWEDIIDYHIMGDADQWVELLESWIEEEEKKGADKENEAVQEDEEVGATAKTKSKKKVLAAVEEPKKDGSILEAFKVTKQVANRSEKQAAKKTLKLDTPLAEVRNFARDNQDPLNPFKPANDTPSSLPLNSIESVTRSKPADATSLSRAKNSHPADVTTATAATTSTSTSSQRCIRSPFSPFRPPARSTSSATNTAVQTKPCKKKENDENQRPDGFLPAAPVSPSKRAANAAPITSSSPPKRISLEMEREDGHSKPLPRIGVLGSTRRAPAKQIAAQSEVLTQKTKVGKPVAATEGQLTKLFKVTKKTTGSAGGKKTEMAPVKKREGLRSAVQDENVPVL